MVRIRLIQDKSFTPNSCLSFEVNYMKTLVKKQYLLPFILITSLFFMWGAAHSILDVLNKHFQLSMTGMTRTFSAMVQVMFYLGYFVMAIPAGILIDRYGYRTGVVIGLLLYGFGALLFWPGAAIMSFDFFLVSLFIIACGLVFLETAANPYVTELGDKETAASRLNLAQSLNGLGCIFGPLLGGYVLFSNQIEANIALPYIIMGGTAMCIAFIFSRIKLPEIADDNDSEQSVNHPHAITQLLQNKAFVFGLIALFSYEISEISINSFFINYATDTSIMSPKDASIALSIGGLGLFMLGRIFGSIIMQHIPSDKVLRYCAIGTVVSTLGVILNMGLVSLSALMLIYIFESIMFPTIFALALRHVKGLTKRASSLLMMSPLGGVVGPLCMGAVADYTNMSFAFVVPLVGYVVVLAYAFFLKKTDKLFCK